MIRQQMMTEASAAGCSLLSRGSSHDRPRPSSQAGASKREGKGEAEGFFGPVVSAQGLHYRQIPGCSSLQSCSIIAASLQHLCTGYLR